MLNEIPIKDAIHLSDIVIQRWFHKTTLVEILSMWTWLPYFDPVAQDQHQTCDFYLCGIGRFAQTWLPEGPPLCGRAGHVVGRKVWLLGCFGQRLKPWCGAVGGRVKWGAGFVLKLLSSYLCWRWSLWTVESVDVHLYLLIACSCCYQGRCGPLSRLVLTLLRGWSPSLSVLTRQRTWLSLGAASCHRWGTSAQIVAPTSKSTKNWTFPALFSFRNDQYCSQFWAFSACLLTSLGLNRVSFVD